MFRKLGWQLTGAFFAVILFSMAMLGFYLLGVLDDQYKEDLRNSLHHEAQLVARLWGQYLESGPITPQQKRSVYTVCDVVTQQYGSRIRILDARGIQIPGMDTMNDPNPVLTERSEVLMALQGQETAATWAGENEGDQPRAAVAFPIRVSHPTRGGGTKVIIGGVVYVSRNLQYLHVVMHALRYEFVVAVALSLIPSAVVGALFSYWLTNPLRRISAAAEQMARGDMNAKVPLERRDEIGDLARSFNFMASELGRRTEELVEERNKLSAVLIHMQGGALMIDVAGHILMKNRAAMAMLGLDDDSAIDQSPVFQALVAQAIVSKEVSRQEMRLASDRIGQVLSTPVKSEAGEPLGFVILINDITELRRVDEMKSEFVSNVSHELRTPLASIKGLAEILLDGAIHEEEGKGFLRSINREINRLTRLVKDLLDLSKIESGLVKFEARSLDIGELLLDVLQRMQARLEGANVETDLSLVGAHVLADPDRVEQVVINLLDNAARYTPSGGTIRLTTQLVDGFQQVSVANEGGGIPKEELSKIFERFYRIDKHRSRDQGGTGLGLSISRHIVERLGGRIWAESDGRWTRFVFTLPAVTEGPEVAAVVSEPVPAHPET